MPLAKHSGMTNKNQRRNCYNRRKKKKKTSPLPGGDKEGVKKPSRKMPPYSPPMRGTGYKINIDERVYELYGLTPDEIAIVEGKSQ
jgi:hypothetical protein